MISFLHTSDWQLGMTRHFLDDEAQTRFSEARFEVIRTMAALAAEEDCAFVVVAGDVFETNQVDRRTVNRALDALAAFDVPVYLLPGNHDCLDPSSVFSRPSLVDKLPPHVEILLDSSTHQPCEGVEVIGAPWRSKAPLRDLAFAAIRDLPHPARHRVLVAHGATAQFDSNDTNPARIDAEALQTAADDGRLSYLALGDRHSTTRVSPHLWYSGAPEPTAYVETDPGEALVVRLGEQPSDPPQVRAHRVGKWHFHRPHCELTVSRGVDELARILDAIDDKRRAIVKLSIEGAASLSQWAAVESLLDEQRDLFAALEQPARHRDVAILPADGDFEDHGLHGWAAAGMAELRAQAGQGGPAGQAATDALGLLLRLIANPPAAGRRNDEGKAAR